MSVQNPISIDDYSEPEPDIALLKPRGDYYSQSLAVGDDVLLIIEVADTSVEYDLNVKLPIYARAGIPEVWIADLPGGRVEVNTEPINGAYQKSRRARRGEIITPVSFSTIKIRVEDILG